MRSAIGHYKGSGSGEVHASRYWDKPGRVGEDFLGKAAPANECDHPVTDLHRVYAFTNFFDYARDLASWSEGHGWFELVFALDDEGVREVHAAGLHAYNHLSHSWLKRLDILKHQALRWSVFLTQH